MSGGGAGRSEVLAWRAACLTDRPRASGLAFRGFRGLACGPRVSRARTASWRISVSEHGTNLATSAPLPPYSGRRGKLPCILYSTLSDELDAFSDLLLVTGFRDICVRSGPRYLRSANVAPDADAGRQPGRHAERVRGAVAVTAAARDVPAGRPRAARANSAAIACHRRARRSIGWSPSRTSMAATSVTARARSTKAQVSAGLVMPSAVPWASSTRRPASWPTGSPRGSQGASPATADTAGCPAARTAARAPMECPISTTGTGPDSAAMASSASFRSPTGEACAPFQPRTRKRGRWTTAPLPRSACRIAAATGIIRSTAGCSAEVGSVLDAWPPCATRTTPTWRIWRREPRRRVGASRRSSSALLPSAPPCARPAAADLARLTARPGTLVRWRRR